MGADVVAVCVEGSTGPIEPARCGRQFGDETLHPRISHLHDRVACCIVRVRGDLAHVEYRPDGSLSLFEVREYLGLGTGRTEGPHGSLHEFPVGHAVVKGVDPFVVVQPEQRYVPRGTEYGSPAPMRPCISPVVLNSEMSGPISWNTLSSSETSTS